MSEHTYASQTVFQTFQYLGYGDRIWPDVENENWQKVENKILAMNIENYLIEHGTFTSSLISTTLTVTLSPYDQSSFEGSINGNYYKISLPDNDVITWTINVTGDSVWYLYLNEITGAIDPTDAASLDAQARECIGGIPPFSGDDLKTRLLMAIVTIVGGVVSIDHDPIGQLTSNNFLAHITDTENPHGSTLVQSNIISDDITTASANIDSLTSLNSDIGTLTLDSIPVYKEFFYTDVFESGETIIDLNSLLGLTTGTANIIFITISPKSSYINPPWLVYDDGILDPNIFTVKNDDYNSISMKLCIKYEII